MKYLAGFGLVLSGFIAGIIAAQYLLVAATEKFEVVHQDFQSSLAVTVETLAERQLREQYLLYSETSSLFNSYKSGDDLAKYLRFNISRVRKGLNTNLLTDSEGIAPELYQDYKEQLEELDRLEEDINFYFGPPN